MSVKHELLSRVPWVCAEKNVEVGMGDLSVSSTLAQEVPPKKPWMSIAFYPFNECLVKAKTPCGNKWFKVINVVYRQEWRRKWQPTPVLLPGKFHGWRSLVGYSPWGCKESDTTERLHFLSFYSSFWRRKWQPTPVFLPRKSHGWRGLVGYSLWGCKKLDMTKQLTHTHTHRQESSTKYEFHLAYIDNSTSNNQSLCCIENFILVITEPIHILSNK